MPQTLTQLHNAQTAVLQHQINSHFLFNTLENIKTISVTELGIDNEVENCIMLLNTIIREADQTHHVGIQNVHKRITNVFGARYGISMENTPPGTTVTIRYPITPQP